MKPFLILAFLMLAVSGPATTAAHPDDIELHLKLANDSNSFHMGEPIEFELSYTSTSEQKYLISASSPMPDFGPVTVHISPDEGAFDPRSLRPCWGGIGGSRFGSTPQFLSSKPITEQSELTEWYRFQRPGHFSVSATSREVSRQRTVEEGGGYETPVLESNVVEFDILPSDPAWEADRMRIILLGTGIPENPINAALISNRLALLDTPDAARKLFELFQSSSESDKYSYASGLLQSTQVDVMIPLLEKALSDPEESPTSVPDLLAQLQVRKQFGALVSGSNDSAGQQKMQEQCQERHKLYDEGLQRANAELLTRVARGAGRGRSAALYEAWNQMENRSAATGEAPADLPKLRVAVLDVVSELTPDQQNQFLISEWKILPHEELRPLARNLGATHRLDAERLWCEDWPSECSAAILTDALQPGSQATAVDVLSMPEAEHPELDAALRKELAESAIARDSPASVRTGALVLRSGSRELLPSVDEALNLSASSHGDNCQVQAYLLGYLFRFAVEDAQQRFGELLSNERCGDQLFRILNRAQYSDAQIPVAIETLDSGNLRAASTAAIFLGEHGPPATEEVLWKRLNALWLTWHDRAAELAVTQGYLGRGPASQSARLEQSLASALSHAKNWKLTEPERSRLRDGCLSEQCRNVTDGKLSFGL
jgi:hypothetical protein